MGQAQGSGTGIKPLPPLPAGILLEILAPYLFRYAAAAWSWSSESQGTDKTYPMT